MDLLLRFTGFHPKIIYYLTLRCRFSEPATPSREAEEKLHLRIESGDSSVLGSRWSQALYIAAGWEPFELVERAVVGASSLSGGAKARQKKQLPPSLDAFGWCTWDAFYSRVSARGGLQMHTKYEESGEGPNDLTCIAMLLAARRR